ncbi:HAD-IIIA family hydrolase [Pseudalkalibacillus sp. SCS-8]|uniref:KdsC family phosphatase n=1 Tax=Pseudalkalibacillus nanhaiensis TaxID=3115291 RepID=UPI0032D9BC5D
MIKILVMDVDGTLTDGKIYCGPHGEIMKAFNVKDGMGIIKVHSKNVIPVIITGRESEILPYRAQELNITETYQGINNKAEKLKELSTHYNCDLSQIAYIGDDENDLDCMKMCGVIGCPADAVDEVIKISDFVSNKNGGEGAVREFIDYLINNNKF